MLPQGLDLLPYLTGEQETSPRISYFYFSDDGDLVAARFHNWKAVFMEQRARGTLQTWMEPFTLLRVPKFYNLRTDPFERADVTSNTYFDWLIDREYFAFGVQAIVGEFLQTFLQYPPRQKAASFTIDQAVARLEAALMGS